MIVTRDQLLEIMPRLKSAKLQKMVDIYYPNLDAALEEFEINTPKRAAAFLAQLAHESAQLVYMEEIASGAAYDNRKDLGNTAAVAIAAAKAAGTTPGRFYKGHGPIQITGYFNHKKVGEALGIDAVHSPELLATAEYGFRAAGYFWYTHGLNALADQLKFIAITKVINGGTNGLKDREQFYDAAKLVLGVK
jgi:putative chitinase